MPPKKKTANGYKFPDPLPKGEIISNSAKKKWVLGPSIGKGGFGEIYSAQEEGSGKQYPLVVKIEPYENGPLFVEINFYIRNAKKEDVKAFMEEKSLKTLGMPVYLGSGTHEYKNDKYRFLVMEKFGTDLGKIFEENKKQFAPHIVFKIAMQMVDVLEYIHRRGYAHGDIKGANILMGVSKETANKQLYLVDFGLACKYTVEKVFKPNPKKAHDGTIEYLSRDAHQGVQTRRGDLEILAYNMIHWLGCKLPWEKILSDAVAVQKSKEEHMKSVPGIVKACFGTKTAPAALVKFLTYLNSLKFDTEPEYDKIKNIFKKGIEEAGGNVNSNFDFSGSKSKTPVKRKSVGNQDTPKKRSRITKKTADTGEVDETEKVVRKPRSKKTVVETNENSEEETEVVVPKSKVVKTSKASKPKVVKNEKPETNGSADPFEGYTEAMKEVLRKKQENVTKRRAPPKRQTKKKEIVDQTEPDNFEGYTDEMKEISEKKGKKQPLRSKNKKTDYQPVPTTSKASDRRGVIKKSTLEKSPRKNHINHAEVIGSSADSDSE